MEVKITHFVKRKIYIRYIHEEQRKITMVVQKSIMVKEKRKEKKRGLALLLRTSMRLWKLLTLIGYFLIDHS